MNLLKYLPYAGWIIALFLLLYTCTKEKQFPQSDKRLPDTVYVDRPLPEPKIIAPVERAAPVQVKVHKADTTLRKKIEKQITGGDIVTGSVLSRGKYELSRISPLGVGYIETHEVNPLYQRIETDMHGNVKITTDKKAYKKYRFKKFVRKVGTTLAVTAAFAAGVKAGKEL